jgi:hypothetical protein
MQGKTVTQDMVRGIGHVIPGKGYTRIMAGKRTLAYANERRAGLQLDFSAADLEGAPARLRKRVTIRRDRAILTVDDKSAERARALLEHVAQKASRS